MFSGCMKTVQETMHKSTYNDLSKDMNMTMLVNDLAFMRLSCRIMDSVTSQTCLQGNHTTDLSLNSFNARGMTIKLPKMLNKL